MGKVKHNVLNNDRIVFAAQNWTIAVVPQQDLIAALRRLGWSASNWTPQK